jgi:hypothetical protein
MEPQMGILAMLLAVVFSGIMKLTLSTPLLSLWDLPPHQAERGAMAHQINWNNL